MKTVTATTVPAIRTVSETDDIHVIEGRLAFGGPFNGRDTYRTFFSARTDWVLDLHPEGVPVLFNHGFDPEFGLSTLGRSEPTASFRTDADGVWVQLQLDKRQKYYATRVRPLLDAGGLGLSQGSAEHSIRIDQKSGEVLLWPLGEISLTPTEANPWNVVATRSAETVAMLRIVAADPHKPATRAYSEAASDAAMGAGALGSLLYLLSCEADEPDQIAMIQRAIDALTEWLDAERAEVGTPEDVAESSTESMAYYTAVRAGKRNAASDQAGIDSIHDATVSLGATAHADSADNQTDDDSPPAEPADDAARSGEPLPPILRIVEREDPAAVRAHLDAEATRIGREAAARLLRT